MLSDELRCLEQFYVQPESCACRQASRSFSLETAAAAERIKGAWLTASFSDLPDLTLKRYFNYHLDRAGKILDTLSADLHPQLPAVIKNTLCDTLMGLIGHLLDHYATFLDLNLACPHLFRLELLNRLESQGKLLDTLIGGSTVDPALVGVIHDYKTGMTSAGAAVCSFCSLRYFRIFLDELTVLDFNHPQINSLLIARLFELNFNDLRFLNYLQTSFEATSKNKSEDLCLLVTQERKAVCGLPVNLTFCCHPSWPAIDTLYSGWLEEISLYALEKTNRQSDSATHAKLTLNTSVAHLACMLRLFYKLGFFKAVTVSDLLKFSCRHFATRRQVEISYGSLSKEYYSVTQSTAARVQGVLQTIISNINREFFPK